MVLKETLPLAPFTASKHSYVTRTLRHFERRWCSFSQFVVEAANITAKDMDGLMLYCYGREQEPSSFPSRTEDGRPVIVCYLTSEDRITDILLDAAAARAVLKESPDLAHDGSELQV